MSAARADASGDAQALTFAQMLAAEHAHLAGRRGGPDDPADRTWHAESTAARDWESDWEPGRAPDRIASEEAPAGSPDGGADPADAARAQDAAAARAVRGAALRADRAALCLSGGGIRSAAFALGVVQGFAKAGQLDRFDYLSTVSGGGYLGAWLTSWMQRAGAGPVIHALACDRAAAAPVDPRSGVADGPEPEPVRHLRAYSNYLTPRLGLLSADTWTLGVTIARNLVMVWATLVPTFLAVILVPHFAAAFMRTVPDSEQVRPLLLAAGLGGFALASAAVAYVHRHRPRLAGAAPAASQQQFLVRCLAPFVGAAVLFTTAWNWAESLALLPQATVSRLLVVAGVAAAVHVVGGLAGQAAGPRPAAPRLLAETGRLAAAGAVVGTLMAGAARILDGVAQLAAETPLAMQQAWERVTWAEVYVSLAAPTFLAVVVAAEWSYIGVNSRRLDDDAREWSARFGAWFGITAAVWLALSGVVFFGPAVLTLAAGRAYHWLAATGVAGLATAVLGRSSLTSAKVAASDRGGAARIVAKVGLAVAAPLFALGVATALALLAQGLLGLRPGPTPPPPASTILGMCACLGVACVAWTLLVPHYVDLNRFSLHAMYRARLIRAFLGASRRAASPTQARSLAGRAVDAGARRAPDGFTGFDAADNLHMAALWPNPQCADPKGMHAADEDQDAPAAVAAPRGATPGAPPQSTAAADARPPLHVVNVALNLVHGRQLAWQQRKAASFTVTALHAGACVLGENGRGAYRPTSGAVRYGGNPPGISLGTAITISGAAASPNMGYHSSPAVTFLLTLLNARLGCWLGNPAAPAERIWTKSGPTSSGASIVAELFGLTDAESDWVYLSDGGHFENLGLYEMVSRRCRRVVVSDAGCDGEYAYEDLGNAIRKVRVDLGVPITFDARLPFRRDVDGKRPGCCVAVGRIHYSAVEASRPGETADDLDGVLLYLKPALTGGEPKDVYNYARAHPAFPHESTGDQFFDEAQFESYRALGQHMASRALDCDGLALWRGFAEHRAPFVAADQAPDRAPDLARATERA